MKGNLRKVFAVFMGIFAVFYCLCPVDLMFGPVDDVIVIGIITGFEYILNSNKQRLIEKREVV